MNILDIESLSKTYRRKKTNVPAVRDASFRVQTGSVTALLGPNGAGKTSVVKMVCDVLTPDAGRVLVNGYEVGKDRRARASLAAVLEGSRNMYRQLSPTENLCFFAGLHGIPHQEAMIRASRWLKSLGLEEKANVPAETLSRGMQQKLAFGIAAICDTPLLILDEPTLGLDVESMAMLREGIVRYSKENGTTVLITTHDMSLVESICDRAVIMSGGRVLADRSIEDWREAFRSRAYRISLSQHDPSLLPVLQTHPSQPIIAATDDGRLEISVIFEDAEQLYPWMDLLRAHHGMIESIGKEETRFEEIFLQVIHKGAI